MNIIIEGNRIEGNGGDGVRVEDPSGKIQLLMKKNHIENNRINVNVLLTHESRVQIIDNHILNAKVDGVQIKVVELEDILNSFSEDELSTRERQIVLECIEEISNSNDSKSIQAKLIRLSSAISSNVVAGTILAFVLKSLGLS